MKTVQIEDYEVVISQKMYEQMHLWVLYKGFLLGVALTTIGFLTLN